MPDETIDDMTRRLLDTFTGRADPDTIGWLTGYRKGINDVRREWGLQPIREERAEK